MVSEKALKEFKEIYKEEYGVDLDDKTALDLAINLLTFFKAIYKPIKKEWADEYDKKIAKESNAEKLMVHLPSGKEVTLPLHRIVFKKWTGRLPDFDFGKKPFIDYRGEPIFAELAILKLFISFGCDGVWVETYGGKSFLKEMPTSWKLAEHSISIPKEKEELLRNIWEKGKTTACFDVFVWKNDQVLFIESKHKGKDKLTDAQKKFIEGALACGIKEESLLILEWEYQK